MNGLQLSLVLLLFFGLQGDLEANSRSQNGSSGFIENKGQMTDINHSPVPFVLFKASAPGMDMYITQEGLTCVFVKIQEEEEGEENENKEDRKKHDKITTEMAWTNIRLKGASIKKENIVKEGAGREHFNFFYPHCPDGIYGVKQFEKITVKDIYPGIDWVLYNHSTKGVKYDFIVHHGADPRIINLVYESKKPLHMNDKGGLEIRTRLGTLNEQAPESFLAGKNIGSKFRHISTEKMHYGGYEVTMGFDVNCDLNKITDEDPLIIDPALVWGTFYGTADVVGSMSIDTDNSGNVFMTGYTGTGNFPVLSAGTYYQGVGGGGSDAFIIKFDNAGTRLWATYYGGSGGSNDSDFANFITTDVNGNVFVAGWTESTNFPVQNSAGAYFQGTNAGGQSDAFILKFDNAGNRLWATYYGGTGWDEALSIATDAGGNVFVTGRTESAGFPTQNAGTFFQGVPGGAMADAFILKFNNAGTRLWATFYGGSSVDEGHSITTDAAGNVFVTGITVSPNFPTQNAGTFFQGAYAGGSGYDLFILKFNSAGARMWATYYGGNGWDEASAILADAGGNVFVSGYTGSTNFPVQNSGTFFQGTNAGINDAFILKFSNTGASLWGTYYGGSGNEVIGTYDNLVVDSCSNVYVGCCTESVNFPTQTSCDNGYFDNSYNGGTSDVGLAVFDNTGARLWATYVGGDGEELRVNLAMDNNNDLFMSGEWIGVVNNGTYPLQNPGGTTYYDGTYSGSGPKGNNHDAYVLKFNSAPCMCSSILAATVTSQNILCNPLCTGTASVTASGGTAPFTYVWSGSQTGQSVTGLCAGNYTVTITDATATTATATLTITQPPALTVSTSVTGAGCGTSNGSATVNGAGGTPGYTYNWNTAPVQTTQTATGLASGNYTVAVTDANGCALAQTVAVTSTSVLNLTMTSTQTGCIVSNGTASASPTNGTSPFTYLWNNGQTTSVATALASGTYTVTVIDAGGCSQTQAVSVTQTPGVPASAVAVPASISSGDSTTLSGSGGGTYQWSPAGNLSCVTCQNPTATPSITTVYCVTVTDTNNCTDSACVTITVTVEPVDCSAAGELYLPNAFSPNKDLENDVLQIYYGDIACIKTLALTIYDRWGEKVFETTDTAFAWDGIYKEKALDPGVFAYYLEAGLVNGQTLSRKGNISLIR